MAGSDSLRRLTEAHVVREEKPTLGDEPLDAFELVRVELPSEAVEVPQEARSVGASASYSRADRELLRDQRSRGRVDGDSRGPVGREPHKIFEDPVSRLWIEQKVVREGAHVWSGKSGSAGPTPLFSVERSRLLGVSATFLPSRERCDDENVRTNRVGLSLGDRGALLAKVRARLLRKTRSVARTGPFAPAKAEEAVSRANQWTHGVP
jgi:hypothetical protein